MRRLRPLLPLPQLLDRDDFQTPLFHFKRKALCEKETHCGNHVQIVIRSIEAVPLYTIRFIYTTIDGVTPYFDEQYRRIVIVDHSLRIFPSNTHTIILFHVQNENQINYSSRVGYLFTF